jgi:ketosteroid isomerase-like protein
MGPIARTARRHYRRTLAAVSRGDLDPVLATFHPRARLIFVSDSSLGAELTGRADIRRWFERFGRLLPAPVFTVQRLVISGPPWRQQVAAHVVISSTVAGAPYTNQFAQFLTLRWGSVTEDVIVEDSQTWERACRRLADHGVEEATAPALQPQ